VFGAENAGGLDNSMNFGLNTTDTRQAALYFRQAQATFECIASEFLGSALGFYVPQLFASPFSETIDDFPRNRPSLYTSYIHHIYICTYANVNFA